MRITLAISPRATHITKSHHRVEIELKNVYSSLTGLGANHIQFLVQRYNFEAFCKILIRVH